MSPGPESIQITHRRDNQRRGEKKQVHDGVRDKRAISHGLFFADIDDIVQRRKEQARGDGVGILFGKQRGLRPEFFLQSRGLLSDLEPIRVGGARLVDRRFKGVILKPRERA